MTTAYNVRNALYRSREASRDTLLDPGSGGTVRLGGTDYAVLVLTTTGNRTLESAANVPIGASVLVVAQAGCSVNSVEIADGAYATFRVTDDTSGSNQWVVENIDSVLGTTTVASAVNQITVANAATGDAPEVQATGSDTNITLQLTPKGSGVVQAAGPLVHEMTPTAVTDTATITAAQLLTKVLDGTPTAAATYTLPTAALLVAEIPDARVGDSFYFVVNNNATATARDITLAAGSGGTAHGLLVVQEASARAFLVVITNVTAAAEAYDLFGIT